METKKNVRDRRMEKIRRLKEGAAGRSYAETHGSHMTIQREAAGRERYPEKRDVTEREEAPPYLRMDPEVEWNRKWKRDYTEYNRDDYNGPPPERGSWKGRMGARILISGFLFAAVWLMYKWDDPLADHGKKWVAASLTESLDVVKLAGWYERKFGGTPSFLPAINPGKHQDATKVSVLTKHYFLPVQGKLIAAFTPGQNGVLIEAKPGSPVSAVDTGWVAFAGNKEDTGFTVVVRHTDGIETVYGHLEQGKVQLNDWIKGGETLGTVAKPQGQASGTIFFAMAKDGKPVNPTDVITFD
ncbi:peptidoglycan DD-metalloendopeptidase family protein [Paenibacillus allorhizosphaerae]|uniref:Stage IV sporulation protein FA n=1 Tax=Paenibacillus allorhizosphaerae TaxID=2849866 RepID=A0ABM8VRJ1_9BACL|nr:M23 family metallopeptidase [Paenibacillus allorhizosphaerae]CAG7655318.1 Stage IV sporulation protein FA [Paenibacillus allorhizosphaerae]